MDSERLLRRFDAWEARTRGMSVRPYRVPVEPSYRPLLGRQRFNRGIIDDSRTPGLLERWFPKKRQKQRREKPEPREIPIPVPYEGSGETVELQLLVRPDFTATPQATAALLRSLAGASYHLSFELLGTPDRVIAQFVCDERDRLLVRSAIKAHVPEARILERRDFLWEQWHREDGTAVIASFGLAGRSFQMLRRCGKSDTDPFTELVGCLDSLNEGELGLVQVLFAPVRSPWARDFEQFVSSIEDVSNVLPEIREKFAEPAFAAVVRIAAIGADEDAMVRIAHRLGNSLISVTRSENNELTHFANRQPFEAEAEDLLARQTKRRGMILSPQELVALVHLPTASVRSERLLRQSTRTKAAPAKASHLGLVLGVNEHDGVSRTVALTTPERLRHTHILGTSGSGKSTLLLSMAIQDINAGNGFAVLDPHGDLIEDIIARIPAERAKDVVLFDPSDEDYPLAFNVLSAHSKLERTLLASDFVSVFRRLSSTTFGDQMVSVLGNAVLAMLESTEGGTLLDLRRFLTEKAFRTRFLETVHDEEVRYYWQHEFPLVKGMPQSSILTRLNTFLRPKTLRYMVAQKDDRFDLRHIMDNKMILLAKLSRGLIGEENSHLLGSLLVAKIAQATVSRQEADAAKRTPFTLYIDEFHHFVTPSVADILSGARKYALGLCLAHHDMRQLRSRSEDVASAVMSHAYTRIVFQVSEQEARSLASDFSFFEARDLQNQNVGEAIARIARSDFDFNLRTMLPEPIAESARDHRYDAVRDASRAAYGTPRAEVEEILKASMPEADASSDEPAKKKRKSRAAAPADAADGEEATLPGRGGHEHKYLQQLVKKLAEDRGFEVSLEKTVLDGHGHVDVALEGHGVNIACEVSVTTRAVHEIGNLTKCLAAGFDYAVLVSPDERVLKSVASAMSDGDDRIRFLSVDGLGEFLDKLSGVDATPRGRKAAKPSASKRAPEAASATGEVKKLLGAKAAAAYVGRAQQTLAKYRVIGGGPKYRKIGGRIVYEIEDLDAWIAEAPKRRSTSEEKG